VTGRGCFVLTLVLWSASCQQARAQVPVVDPRPLPTPVATRTNGTCEPGSFAGKRRLTVHEARCAMVALINRDRAEESLPPVELDESAPTKAGQAHAADMASHGFLGHWGTDGSVPEQRLSEAGGSDMVLENALCFTDEAPRTLDPAPLIAIDQIEKAEAMFFHEVPPNDGHRKNILKPFHKRVGVGIAQPVPTATEIPVPCFSQEFVDPYGRYAPIPATLHPGQRLHVEGSVFAPAVVAGVGLARIPLPIPISVAEVNRRRSYPVPAPYQMYWPPGYETPIPLRLSGLEFAIDVPVSDGGKTGLYELSIWAKLPHTSDFAMIGLRTLRVE
jgi:uncharacterized protein YkwD